MLSTAGPLAILGKIVDCSGNASQVCNSLVSILIPSHNAKRWIRQSIESALAQTYSRKEVIVVDDGSTDGTPDIIREFGGQVRFVAVPHAGGNAARNRLLQMAQGEWIQYLDADDYLHPHKVAGQMQYLRQRNFELDVIFSPFLMRDDSSPEERPVPVMPGDDPAEQFIFWTAFCTHGVLLRKSAVVEVQGWNEAQPVCQEHELLLRLLMAGKRFGRWNQAAAVYRYHDSPSVSRKSPLRTIRMRMELTDRCENFLRRAKRLTSRHRRALFTVRLENARSVWRIDRRYARQLAGRAFDCGKWWVQGCPALPPRFQLALWLVGFEGAQHIARLVGER